MTRGQRCDNEEREEQKMPRRDATQAFHARETGKVVSAREAVGLIHEPISVLP